MDLDFKPEFIEHYSKLPDWEEFRETLATPAKKSIRVNTLKTTVEELVGRLETDWKLTPIPWCSEGFWIEDRRGLRWDIGNIPEHNQGLFFIQEAASMIPALVLDPQPGERVLDLCASPGGKTTQIAEYMQNTGELVANDIRGDRIAILERNLKRMDVTNCIVSMKPGQHYRDDKFDRVLVDAPCSATGTMRGSIDAIDAWDPQVAERISFEQRSLLHHAYCVLKRGGLLVYSTCSLEPVENEAVVDYLLKRHKKTEVDEILLPGLEKSEPVREYNNQVFDERVSKTLRIWPQDNNTDGFYIAKIRKTRK